MDFTDPFLSVCPFSFVSTGILKFCLGGSRNHLVREDLLYHLNMYMSASEFVSVLCQEDRKEESNKRKTRSSLVVFCGRRVNNSTEIIKSNQNKLIWSTYLWDLWNILRPKIIRICSFPTTLIFYKTFSSSATTNGIAPFLPLESPTQKILISLLA